MTLNEKLEFISELEDQKFNSTTIDTLVESIEHPERNNGPFTSVEELWAHIDNISEEETVDEEN